MKIPTEVATELIYTQMPTATSEFADWINHTSKPNAVDAAFMSGWKGGRRALLDSSDLHRLIDEAVNLARKEAERAALERAAQRCDEIEKEYWSMFKHADADSPLRGNQHVGGQSDGAGECATAIRALMQDAQSGEDKQP
jgi:hypothetical protein